MLAFRGLGARARRRLGREVHRIGGATRSDVRDLRSHIDQLNSGLEKVRVELAESTKVTSGHLNALAAQTAAQEQAHREFGARLARLENLQAIDAFRRFVRHAQLRTEPLVSVVLPTFDRLDRLRHAIGSVIAQRYTHWELIVVDDGGQLDSQAVVEEAQDPRVRWMRVEHQGVCAARNAALERAGGELIAYLDDDNAMDVDWLYSLV